ncbi:MAG: DUF3108 domain-containing protein [Candidatus Eisenbacteria sp.]|nr:DUF3108 domain-containing protein [Candidatus Eisenbacteria bacterium]
MGMRSVCAAISLLGCICLAGDAGPSTGPGFSRPDPVTAPSGTGLDLETQLLPDSPRFEFKAVSIAEWERRAFLKTHPHLDDVFVLGERLIFSVRYGPIRAGEATMSIGGIEVIDGDSCFHIVTTARSNSFFSTFYFVNDRVESFIDTRYLLSRRFEKHLIEGDYRNNTVVTMDQRNHLAIHDDGRIFEMKPRSHDLLSAFYEVRARHPMEPGDGFDLESHVDRKNYPIHVKVHRRERIKVPAGEFDCLVVEPVMRSEGLFKHQGQLMIWLTDDRRRIPVQMKSKLPIGAISVVLVDVDGRQEWETG